jgi:hypothetical protein
MPRGAGGPAVEPPFALPGFVLLAVVLLFPSVSACSSRRGTVSRDGGPGLVDLGPLPTDQGIDFGGSVNPCSPGCGPMELCGEDGTGNGLDDDCNGRVDETCTCPSIGITRPCFPGPPDRRGLGTCQDGIETCTEFLVWSECRGAIGPAPEVCDGADNDCDNITDNDLPGCSSAVSCPGAENAPPLSRFPLNGNRLYTGAGSGWNWRVECPASVPPELCPAPSSPTSKVTDVYFTASGAYRVSVTFTTDDGMPGGCAWTVYVQGSGLRIELNWDTMASGVDMDLHLHRWTRNGVDTPFYNDDDCYYGNCQPENAETRGRRLFWMDHPNNPDASACREAPHGGGPIWQRLGYCANPRLDVDTNGTDGRCDPRVTDPARNEFCAPENINVDNPIVGMPYRVMVNYYSGGLDVFGGGAALPTHPTVNIYCGGALRASFGTDPFVTMRAATSGGFFPSTGPQNDNWYVADVVFFNGLCGVDCMVYPVDIAGTALARASGLGGELPFGPPWSCNYDAASGTCR